MINCEVDEVEERFDEEYERFVGLLLLLLDTVVDANLLVAAKKTEEKH